MDLHVRTRVLLCGTLLVACALRFMGLDSGLRHRPVQDERYFVENVQAMLEQEDLDHRFQEYPGLFFYMLRGVLAFAPRPHHYLLARALVAAFGVLSVGLAYALGARLFGSRVGLVAATFLAVSPVEVFTAHKVRPDVVLESFVLLALLAFTRLGERPRDDVLAGAAVGAATAVKFSGVLVAVPYLAQQLLMRPVRPSRLLLAGIASVVAFAALSPYSLLHFGDFLDGVRTQIGYHYVVRGRGRQDYPGMAHTYVRFVLAWAMGLPGLLLGGFGLWTQRANWRRWLPLLLLPLVAVAVFSTAEVHRSRLILPTLGALAVLIGLGADALFTRVRYWLALAATLAALVSPLARSIHVVHAHLRPTTLDAALDWLLAHAPAGSKVFTSARTLGIDPSWYEVIRASRLAPATRRQALHADFVVATADDDPAVVAELRQRFAAGRPLMGPALQVLSTEGLTPRYSYLDLREARLSASEQQGLLGNVRDGDLATIWYSDVPQRPGQFIQVDLPAPAVVGRIDLALGAKRSRHGADLQVLVNEGGTSWRRVSVLPGRAPVPEQIGPIGGEVLLLDPIRVTGLRIVQQGRRNRSWGIAELRIGTPD